MRKATKSYHYEKEKIMKSLEEMTSEEKKDWLSKMRTLRISYEQGEITLGEFETIRDKYWAEISDLIDYITN